MARREKRSGRVGQAKREHPVMPCRERPVDGFHDGSTRQRRERVRWLSRLVGAVADDLEHEAAGIKEVGGIVLAVFGEVAGFMDDLGVVSDRPAVGLADDGTVGHRTGQVLQAGAMA
jgi:hypothetical protein